jgi:hypothetical protein
VCEQPKDVSASCDSTLSEPFDVCEARKA